MYQSKAGEQGEQRRQRRLKKSVVVLALGEQAIPPLLEALAHDLSFGVTI